MRASDSSQARIRNAGKNKKALIRLAVRAWCMHHYKPLPAGRNPGNADNSDLYEIGSIAL
jgi:hypothetical protein